LRSLFFLNLKSGNVKGISIYEYTAFNDRYGASDIVRSYGVQPSNNPLELSQQLAFCVSKGGKEALDKVAKIHPDFNLIKSKVKESEPEKPTHSNACGCNSFSGVDGQNAKAEVKSRLTDKTELLITGGIVLIGLAMVLKLMK